MCHALALIAGYILDLIIGDPHGMPHPIRLIGRLISWVEKKTYKDGKMAGSFLVITVTFVTVLVTGVILTGSYKINMVCGIIVEAVMTFFCLATKSLAVESGIVIRALENEGIESARKSLSMIVGRDTKNLNEADVIKACVETVAENTSDGVVAPMLYLAVGGPILGFLYKAVNTMDSMVGYRNDRYSNYGCIAAKTDDVFNYLPSRITALIIILAAWILSIFCGNDFSGANAFKIWRRDRRNHKSPNSAQSESAYAGALGLRLAGGAFYFGKWVEKPYIGDEINKIKRQDVKRSHILLYATSVLCVVICTVAIFIIIK